MRETEVIRYGSIEEFHDVGSPLEFYDRLGLTPRFGPEDICHVDQLRVSEKDHWRLRDLIQAEVQRRDPFLIGRVRDSAARMARADWFSRAPLPNVYNPEGELWIVASEFLGQRVQEVLEGMSNLDRRRGGAL